jgi:hypothetical protein
VSADQPVQLSDVLASKWRFTGHFSLQDRHIMTRECVDFPQLHMSVTTPKGRKSKATPGRAFWVAGVDGVFNRLVEAIDALNQRDLDAEAPAA